MAYKVISADNIDTLNDRVNKLIDEGYEVQGGVCVTANNGYRMFYQAVILKDNTAQFIPLANRITFRGRRNPIPKEIPLPYQQTMN